MRISDWSSDVCSSDLHARAPRAEMLGGEILAHRLADIIVDVGRADRMRLARLIEPGEQVLAGQIVAVAPETDQRDVGDRELPYLAPFGLVYQLWRSEARRVGKEGVSTGEYRGTLL